MQPFDAKAFKPRRHQRGLPQVTEVLLPRGMELEVTYKASSGALFGRTGYSWVGRASAINKIDTEKKKKKKR